MIDVWWGDTQTYGDTGFPQPYYNLHGNVSDPDGLDSLTYTLNGGASRNLNIGADNRRLARPGDFNADIPFADLQLGANEGPRYFSPGWILSKADCRNQKSGYDGSCKKVFHGTQIPRWRIS